jgi:hypothetical protein
MEYLLLAFLGVLGYIVMGLLVLLAAMVLEIPYWLERTLVWVFNPALRFWYWVASL